MIKLNLFISPILKSNSFTVEQCLVLVFFTLIQQEELMGWHVSGVKVEPQFELLG